MFFKEGDFKKVFQGSIFDFLDDIQHVFTKDRLPATYHISKS